VRSRPRGCVIIRTRAAARTVRRSTAAYACSASRSSGRGSGSTSTAPAARAAAPLAPDSAPLHTRIAVGVALMMRSIASRPSVPGRSRPISTTQGRNRATSATASRPLRASLTTVKSPSSSTAARRNRRCAAESSTISTDPGGGPSGVMAAGSWRRAVRGHGCRLMAARCGSGSWLPAHGGALRVGLMAAGARGVATGAAGVGSSLRTARAHRRSRRRLQPAHASSATGCLRLPARCPAQQRRLQPAHASSATGCSFDCRRGCRPRRCRPALGHP
jgi:hypothetical protein